LNKSKVSKLSEDDLLTKPCGETLEWIRQKQRKFLQGDDEAGAELLAEPGILMSTILYIITKTKTRQLLIPNIAQTLLLQAVETQRQARKPIRIIILKARQEGMSTGIAGWMFLNSICQRNVSVGVVADLDENAALLFEKYRIFDEELPDGICPSKRYNVRGKRLVYENADKPAATDSLRSRIDVIVASDASTDQAGRTGRSRTYNYLHLSETAFWANAAATVQSLFQTVPDDPNTAIFNESTGKGYGDHFHQEWERACKKQSDFLPLFLPWFIHHEYTKPFDSAKERKRFEGTLGESEQAEYSDELSLLESYELTFEQLNWRRWQIRNKCNGRVATFRQEYPSTPEEAFQVGGHPVISPTKLSVYLKECCPPIMRGDWQRDATGNVIFNEDANGLVTVWQPPQPGCEYVIGSDHAEGLDSGDFNVAVVMERLTQAVVARLRGYDGRRVTPDDFADHLAMLGEWYNEAWINPENNLDGGTVSRRLENELHYRRLLDEIILEVSQTKRVGWRNNTATRKRVVNLVVDFFEKENGEVPDRKLIEEGLSFVWVNGKPQARRKFEKRMPGEPELGFYDDCLFALGGALLGHQYLPAPMPRRYVLKQQEQEYVDPEIAEIEDRNRSWLKYI